MGVVSPIIPHRTPNENPRQKTFPVADGSVFVPAGMSRRSFCAKSRGQGCPAGLSVSAAPPVSLLTSPTRRCCSCSFRITDILSDPVRLTGVLSDPTCLTGILSAIPLCRRSFRQSGSRSFSLPLQNPGSVPTPHRSTAAEDKKPTCQKASRFPVGKTTPKLYGSLLDQPPFAAALLALLALPVLGVTGLPIWDSAVLIWGSSATAVSRMVAFWLSVSADSRSGVMP